MKFTYHIYLADENVITQQSNLKPGDYLLDLESKGFIGDQRHEIYPYHMIEKLAYHRNDNKK